MIKVKKINKKFKTIIAFTVIIIASFAIIFIAPKLNNFLSTINTGAIYGGQLETGYPYAGYLAAYQDDNKVTTCGVSFINSTTAISAAHCIPQNATVFVGTDNFKVDPNSNVQALDSSINTLWEQKPANDVSVIKLSNPVNINQFIQVAGPAIGCNYTVVGYGLDETNNTDLSAKVRKSATLCITDIFNDTAYVQGQQGGICYGDSGSPVFETGTNKLVGIISSIITSDSSTSNYCSIDNRAVMVRIDNNLNFINSIAETTLASETKSSEGAFCSITNNIGCVDGSQCVLNKCVKDTVTISAASTSQVNQQNILQVVSSTISSGNVNYIIISVIGILLIILLILIIRKRKK